MHARIAAFENRDMSRADELVRLVRDRQSAGEEIPGALALYMLVDRTVGTALGISIFESEEAIAAAEPAFERMGDEIPEALRGRRMSIDRYEVALHDVAAGATAARVSTFAVSPEGIDASMRLAVESVLPEARTMAGWKGMLLLLDRRRGIEKVVTLWESRAALEASERQADELRRRAAEEADETVTGVERYDVPFAFDRAPRLVRA